MKTIEEASEEYVKINTKTRLSNYVTKTDFKAGVEFAQRWIPIERDNKGFSDIDQMGEMNDNSPFLIKDEDGWVDLWREVDKNIKMYYTHWRPVYYK